MAFPDGLTLITVTGQLAGLPDGATGVVTFRWPWLQGPDGEILAGGELTALTDSEGEFTANVPATNDPAWAPTGWTMRVTVVRGTKVTRGTITLPYDGGAVELADGFNPDDAVEPGETYSLSNHTHPGGGGGGSTAWADITGKPSTFPPSAHTHPASAISDSTTVGRAVMTAADAAAARTAIGAGTSSLALGTTGSTAAAGNHTHPDLATDAELAALDARVVDLEEAPGGGGSTLVVRRNTVTSGNLTMASAGAWVAVAGGPSMVLPAAVGDYVQFDFPSLLGSFSTNFIDLAVLVGGTIVRCLSSGTATPATEGAPGFYGDQSFDRTPPVFEFEVEAGDLSGGNVTVQLITKGSGGGTVYANSDYPLKWRAMNYGPADVA